MAETGRRALQLGTYASSGVPEIVIDAHGTIIDANDRVGALLGRCVETLRGVSMLRIVARQDVEITGAYLRQVARGYTTTSIEIHLDHADAPVLAQVAVGTTDGEKILLLLREVGARRELDAELAASESRKAQILAGLHEGLVVQTAAGDVVEWNPAAERILGLTADHLSGRAGLDPRWHCVRANGTAWPIDELPASQVLASGQAVEDEVLGVHHADGTLVWVLCNAVPFIDDDGTCSGVCVSFVDITARTIADDKLRWQAFHDALTGLPNRALLLERIDHALARSQRTGEIVAAFFLDLDRFKLVNDTLGHDAGDELLHEVSQRLTGVLRLSDTIARLGGDEFVIAAEGITSMDEVDIVARRILGIFDAPFRVGGRSMVVTSSIGVAVAKGHDAESLLRDADTALYRAKDRGRNRHEVFDETLRMEAIKKLTSEEILRAALEGDGVAAFYQPVVDLVTGSVVSCEALLRIPGPTGLQAPGDFIQIAEETGLIVQIGAGVLDDACRRMSQWRRKLGLAAPAHVSVNVSSRQLANAGFAGLVLRTLDAYGLTARDLILEFTETVIVEADVQTSRNITELHESGVTLAVDDFGTGYSSLSYLKRFPLDIVKLDRAFVDGVDTDSEDTEIVRAVLALSRALGLSVTAEGIETPEQLDALRALGCDHGQGYLLARPASPADTAETLARAPWYAEFRRHVAMKI